MGCFSKTQPQDIYYGAQLAGTLNNQSQVAPQQLALEQQYQPQYAQLAAQNYNTVANGMSQTNMGNMFAGLNQARGYAPQLADTVRGINPQSQGLLNTLNSQAASGLAAGTRLRPEDTNAITKNIAGNYANRGFGPGLPAAQLEQALQLYGAGQGVQQQRQNFAGNVLNLNQSQVDNPTLQLLGQYLNGGAQAAGGASAGTNQLLSQSGPSLFNPESSLAAQIAAGNQQMQAMFSSSTADKAGNAIAPLNSAAASY